MEVNIKKYKNILIRWLMNNLLVFNILMINYHVYTNKVVLGFINKDSIRKSQEYIICLIQLIMNLNYNNFLCSITHSDDEITIFVDEIYLDDIQNYVSSYDFYYAIRFTDTEKYFHECGFINKISNILADNGISILYITTANNNYILIKPDDKELVDELLKKIDL